MSGADASPPPPKVFIKTYGCQMNVYDSERMGEALTTGGYMFSDTAEDADLILLNTCHIREKAAEKLYSELGRLRPLKVRNPKLTIGVTGCVAQAEGAEISRRQPLVDLVVGPQSYHRLCDMVAQAKAGRSGGTVRGGDAGARVATNFPVEGKFALLPGRQPARNLPSAFLTVQEGCDKFCTFCVVPYTRGAESSRPVAEVLAEARKLVDAGAREITLLGQNVNAYHGVWDGGDTAVGEGVAAVEISLADLIHALADIDGLDRIRFVTSHPRDMSEDLIAAFGTCPKLMPYLHLPLQSGSDAVLKRMNRGHTGAHYCRLIERLRSVRSDLLLSSDFIVGFPGETEDDFQATIDVVARVGFGQAYAFCYSPRPGTPAAEREQVPAAVSRGRLHRLQELLGRQQRAALAAMVGHKASVLFERCGRHPGQMVGKSEYFHAVHVNDTDVAIGDLRCVRIAESGANSLFGVLA